jgi:hypothetical protein
MFIFKIITHPVDSVKNWLTKDDRLECSVDSPKVIDNGLFYEKRDDEDRRTLERRSTDRRDDFSWRSQIWKRTSLSQFCRRKNERRDNERRTVSDRRDAGVLAEN